MSTREGHRGSGESEVLRQLEQSGGGSKELPLDKSQKKSRFETVTPIYAK